jgi:hypothetical protein
MVFETIVGVAVGIFMLHEEIHEDAWGIAVSLLALASVLGGLVALAQSQGAAEEHAAPVPAPAATPVSTS